MRSVATLLMIALSASACTQLAETSGVQPVTDVAGAAVGSPMEASEVAEGQESERDEPMAPEFPAGLGWINTDRPLTLAELRGRFVLLDFWTYGCINCIHIIPDLHRLEEEFADELVVIGVHSAKFDGERSTEGIRDVVLRYGIEHPVVNDAEFEIWQSYGVRAWPTVWLIHPEGHLIGRLEGEGVYEVVAPVLRELVAEAGSVLETGRFETVAETAPASLLFYPGKVEAQPGGDLLAIADTGHHQVILADRVTGEVRNVLGSGERGFVDGVGLEASFDSPQGMVFVDDGLYVADTGNHSLRHVDLTTGLVTTVAGTGAQGRWPPTGGEVALTPLYSPWDLVLNDSGRIFVAMAGSHQIWEFDPSAATIHAYAGSGRESTLNGPRSTAELAQPSGLTLSPDGVLFFADSESSSIRSVTDEDVGLVAGASRDLFSFGHVDAVGDEARFQHPLGVEWWDGLLYVADTYNDRIRTIDPETALVNTLIGGEPGWADGVNPRFDEPGGISITDGVLYIADTNNHAIRMHDLATGETDTLVLKGIEAFRPIDPAAGATLEAVHLTEGAVELTVDVTFPDGYKLNPEAPASFTWTSTAGTIAEPNSFLVNPDLPITFDATVNQSGSFTLEMGLVYCEEEEESICLFEQALLELPVTVGGTETDVAITHEVTLP